MIIKCHARKHFRITTFNRDGKNVPVTDGLCNQISRKKVFYDKKETAFYVPTKPTIVGSQTESSHTHHLEILTKCTLNVLKQYHELFNKLCVLCRSIRILGNFKSPRRAV